MNIHKSQWEYVEVEVDGSYSWEIPVNGGEPSKQAMLCDESCMVWFCESSQQANVGLIRSKCILEPSKQGCQSPNM